MLHASLVADDATPLGTRLPVVLVHGWCSSPADWAPFAARAAQHPRLPRRCKLYRFGYDSLKPIGANGEQLARELAQQPEFAGRPVVLVGHSMGGLVSRACAEGGPAERLAALHTLGTPHHGSPAANWDWLATDSRYSFWLRHGGRGLFELFNAAPRLKALFTEGGHNLGWDNYDQTMPPDLWLNADRWIAGLNARFERLPQRAELLARYRLVGSFRAQLPALSLLKLRSQLLGGRELEAGAALVAHGLLDRDGHEIPGWRLNDGIVTLDSALFLQPGESLLAGTVEQPRPRPERLAARLRRPGLGQVLPDLDHFQLCEDPRALEPLFDQLSDEEPNALALQVDGRLSLWRPGPTPSHPLRDLGAGVLPLASTAGDRLVVVDGDALAALTPDSRRVLARGVGPWRAEPRQRYALSSDGLLVGLAQPRGASLGQPSGPPLWSADGSQVAVPTADHLVLCDLDGLRLRRLAPTAPRAWSADGQRLVTGEASAWLSADGREAALLDGGESALWNSTGERLADWTSPRRPGTLTLKSLAGEPDTALADEVAVVTYAADGRTLSWIGGAARTELAWRAAGEPVRRLSLPYAVTALTPTAVGLLAAASDGQRAYLLLINLTTGEFRALGRTPGAPSAAPTVSPDGRWAAVEVAGGVLVAATDGSASWLLNGTSPLWLKQPAAQRWAEATEERP